MSAYYNEIDPFAAAWLRELIKHGHIAPGDVDERSIEDITPNELKKYTQCHFFAGIGVWSHALRQAGWSDDTPIWTGSCPCQPFSTAGKGKGTDDERHLWPAFHWLIKQCHPRIVLGEQVASKDGLEWFDGVSTDLEGENYTCSAVDTCAASVGAPHIRQRLYWVGHTVSKGLEGHRRDGATAGGTEEVGPDPTTGSSSTGPPSLDALPVLRRVHLQHSPDTCSRLRVPTDRRVGEMALFSRFDALACSDGWRRVQSGTFPLANGSPARVGRLRGYGNAIVAPQAQAFIEVVQEILDNRGGLLLTTEEDCF